MARNKRRLFEDLPENDNICIHILTYLVDLTKEQANVSQVRSVASNRDQVDEEVVRSPAEHTPPCKRFMYGRPFADNKA